MKKIAYAVLAGLFVCGAFAGCKKDSGGKTELQAAKTWDYKEATSIVYDCFDASTEVMPILGYWNAPGEAMHNGQYFPEMKNDEYFTAVKESGVNLLVQTNDDARYDDSAIEKTLDYCDKYGLGYYVTNYDLYGGDTTGAFHSTKDKLKAFMEKCAEHESFAGLYINDEPRPIGVEATVNKSLRTFYSVADDLKLNVHPYLNLNPSWQTWYQPDAYTQYRTHIDEIYDNTKMSYIMYDVYPLKGKGFNYEWYYSNLSIVRKGAEDKNIAWIPFVNVASEGSHIAPSEGELSWQVNQYLAFGAKGISYFPINSPLSFTSDIAKGEEVAMFDYLGNKTECYYFVKEVNKQIQAVDEYLMNATNHGVVVNGTLTGAEWLHYGEIIQNGKFRELTSVSGDHATVGCFDYYGKTCLYVVNGSMHEDSSVTLNFDNRYAFDVIQRGQTAGVKGTKMRLSLAAGEAAFVILK